MEAWVDNNYWDNAIDLEVQTVEEEPARRGKLEAVDRAIGPCWCWC